LKYQRFPESSNVVPQNIFPPGSDPIVVTLKLPGARLATGAPLLFMFKRTVFVTLIGTIAEVTIVVGVVAVPFERTRYGAAIRLSQ
jgi:hypothetical protein